MSMLSSRPILVVLACLTLSCAQSGSDETPGKRNALPPGTRARLGAAREAARAADSSAPSALIADSASSRTTGVGSCGGGDCDTSAAALPPAPAAPPVAIDAAAEDSDGFPLADPAFGALAVVPAVYTDSSTCPGEGCYKGLQWGVRVKTALFSRPDTTSPVTTTLEPNTDATALGWMTYTVPQPFIVHRAVSIEGRQGDRTVRGEHAPGDTIWVVMYLGEGHFRVRLRNGALVDDHNLGFSAGGGSFGKRCESHRACWGVLAAELETVHWLKVRAPNGREGWTKTLSAFVIPD